MAIESPRDPSPDQAYAHKVAVRELAKYCQDIADWRKTKRASATLDKRFGLRGPLAPAITKSAPPVPRSST